MARAKQMSDEAAVTTPGEAFGRRLKQVRQRRGWTQAQLSRRLSELDYPIDRVTLSKIERGGERAQNVKLQELLAIAYALGVPPVQMMFPYEDETRVRVIGKQPPAPADDVRGWIAGQWPLYADDDKATYYLERPPQLLSATLEWMQARKPVPPPTPEWFGPSWEPKEEN